MTAKPQEDKVFRLRKVVAYTTANVVQWQLAAALVLASLAASGQTAEHAQTRPVQPDSDQAVNFPYQPITGRERGKWFLQSTIGPQSLAAGVFSAGFGTAINSPMEYGGTWEGFGKRYGMRLTGVSTGNAMEAGIGALWGEDPRYFRAPGKSFGMRVQNIVKMTFVARRQNGNFAPAYARYVATAGNNVLSNTWRVDSEADAQHAAVRTLLGFVGRMGGNAFQEFWHRMSDDASLRRNPDKCDSSAIRFPFRPQSWPLGHGGES